MDHQGVKVTYIETQFVTSDAAGFKDLVQRLTGRSAPAPPPAAPVPPPPPHNGPRACCASGSADGGLVSSAAAAAAGPPGYYYQPSVEGNGYYQSTTSSSSSAAPPAGDARAAPVRLEDVYYNDLAQLLYGGGAASHGHDGRGGGYSGCNFP